MPSSPTDLERTFSTLLSRNARQWRKALNEELKPKGLTEATWLPLLHLSRAGVPMLQKDLAHALTLDRSSVVRLIDELEASGHVTRGAVLDRRAKPVCLTPLGRRTVLRVEAVADAARQRFLSGVSAKELACAVQVMEKVARALEAADQGVAA